jgi:transglutaminase-like putative cysteine protease
MKAIVFLFYFLLQAAACQATAAGTALKLSGYTPNLVRWLPATRHEDYLQLAPPAERIAVMKQLGYGSVVIDETHDLHLDRNKLVRDTVSVSQLYLTAKGIESDGNHGFWLDANHQRAEIEAAYVVQPDGTVADVDPNTLQLNNQNSYNIFTDTIYVTVPFAQLRPGSIAVLRYRVISDRNKLQMPWARILYPQNFYPLEHFAAEVHWDDAAQKPAWQTDYAKLDCREGRQELTCSTRDASVPIPSENQMPSPIDVLPTLILAEPNSWAAVSESIYKLAEPALSHDDKIADLAMRLRGGASDIREIVSRLSAFVSRDIRYIGLERGKGSVIPRPTTATLDRRFGDCKDKTMLFVEMARDAGLDAYRVLTSTGRMSLAKLPLPSGIYFNHMLACVKSGQTGEICVDLTDPDTGGGHLPFNLQGAVALAVGHDAIAPHNLDSEPFTWIVRTEADNRLNDDGSVAETLERQYDTHWAAGVRRSLLAKSQAEREQWLYEDYRSVMGEKAKPVFSVRGLDTADSAVAVVSTAEYRNVFDPLQLKTYRDIEPWMSSLVKDVKTQNKYYPYKFRGIHYHSEIRYQLYAGKKVNNVGPKIDYVSRWGSLHRHYRLDGSRVVAYTDLQMPRTEVPLEKIAEFNRFLELIGQENQVSFSMTAAEVGSN